MTQVCTFWSTTDSQWSQANWTWDECQIVEGCLIWGTAGVTWQNASQLWACNTGSTPPQPPTGSLVGNLPGVDAMTLIQPWLQEPWNPYRAAEEQAKKKRLVKLICKVKGKTFEESKYTHDFEVSVEDIKLIVKTIAKVDLDLKWKEHTNGWDIQNNK